MTDEQTKYRRGQIVHVRMRVFQSGPNDEGRVCLETLDRRDIADLDVADIVSAEPGPLKVGDRVRWWDSATIWRIVALDHSTATCMREGVRFPVYGDANLLDLVRA